MKKIIYTAAAAAMMLSCVNDLDTLPLNKTEPIAEYVYGNSEQAYLEGLSSVGEQTHLQGRWQTISREPLVVCDTGHNAHGLRYVAAELERCLEQYDRVICVIGFAKEKDLSSVLPLLPKRAYYIFTQAAVSRALPAEELAQAAGKEGLSGETVVGVAEALQRAKQMARSEDMIFVGGSNFVVAEIL